MSIHFKGVIKKVVYENHDTAESGVMVRNTTVLSGVVPPTIDLGRTMCTGIVADAFPGVEIDIVGELDDSGDFSKIRIIKSECNYPKKTSDILEYMAAGAIAPLHSYAAKKLVAHYGGGALVAMNAAPEELVNVLTGMTTTQMTRIAAQWKIRRSDIVHHEMFERYSVPINVRRILIDRYLSGDKNTFKVFNGNPYLYCYHKGTKFEDVDQAVKAGGDNSYFDHPLNPARVMGAIFSELNDAENTGNTAIKVSSSLYNVCKRLGQGTPEYLMTHVVMPSIDRGTLYVFERGGEKYIQKRDWYIKEREIAGNFYRLLSAPNYINTSKSPVIDTTGKQVESQRFAVETCLRSNVGVITGGPGTGKTTTLKSLIVSLEASAKDQGKKHPNILLIAPSGLASVRMNESTGMPTTTIHKALGAKLDGRIDKGLADKIDADVVVIDEISMLDAELLHGVLSSLKTGTRLYMLGDQDQLPSVSPGAVISDIVSSSAVPVGRLTEVFRFDETSLIGVNARNIRDGVVGDPTLAGSDWEFIETQSSIDAASGVLDTFERIWKNKNIDPHEIQILCSQKNGATGVLSLNKKIQNLINPVPAFSDTLKFGSKRFNVGDKIICKEKSKRTGLAKGQIGRVESIKDGVLIADFEGVHAQYSRSQLSSVDLAWALTIHKSQGSEYPYVITPVDREHEYYFTNQKLFTAVTRCKTKMHLVGNPSVYGSAVNNRDGMERITGLLFQIESRLPSVIDAKVPRVENSRSSMSFG